MSLILKNKVYTVIVTPFDQKNNIDYESINTMLQYQLCNNIKGILLLGTTSESPTLNLQEKQNIVTYVWEKYGQDFEILVGIGGNNTRQVKLFGDFVKDKCHGFMITVPNYNKPSQQGIFQHFDYLAKTFSDKPILMYNIPSRCGVNMSPDIIRDLFFANKNIIGIKEASGSLEQAIQIKNLCDIKIFSGDDSLILPILAIGGVGVVSVASNIIPKQILNIINLFHENFEQSQKEYYKYHELIKSLFITTNPVPVKYILKYMELTKTDNVRLPLVKMNSDEDFKLINHKCNILSLN